MTKSLFRFFLPTLFLILIACEDDNPAGTNDPTNLSVEVTVADDGSGKVDISATASNTVEYHFYFGDAIDAQPVVNTTGQISYTYSNSGVFVIETRAYGSSGRFIKTEEQISVIVDNGTVPDDGYITPPAYDGMTLIWADEFNGTRLDESFWSYETGTGNNGWGNQELQYYRPENTSVSGGYLTIEARKENYGGSEYTSSRLVTMSKFSFKFGRVDIRAKLPKDQGLWPALWMLGSNFSQPGVGWPACGEIDIMELVGGSSSDDTVHGTIHWQNTDGSKGDTGGSYTLNEGIFNDNFHVFTLNWTSTELKWYVDDQLYLTQAITSADRAAFQNNFFFIFNVAVGGLWPGSPDGSTVFPQQMVVDYVRVFQPN